MPPEPHNSDAEPDLEEELAFSLLLLERAWFRCVVCGTLKPLNAMRVEPDDFSCICSRCATTGTAVVQM